jgi:hypothetical protein
MVVDGLFRRLRGILKDFTIFTATSGAKGVEIMDHNNIDFVILICECLKWMGSNF